MLLSVEVFHREVVGLGSPARVGATGGLTAVGSAVAHAVDLLYVIPSRVLHIEGHRTVVLDTDFVFIGFFRSDENDTMRGTAAVECRGGGAFQHGHVFDVVGVDGRDTIAQVKSAFRTGAAEVGIVERYTVDDIQRLVVAADFRITAQQHACTAAGTSCRVLHHQTGHFARQRVDDVGLFGLCQLLTLHLGEGIAQGLALTFHTKGSDHHLTQLGLVLHHHNFHARSGFYLNGGVAHIAHLQLIASLALQREATIQVGHCSDARSCHLDRGTYHGSGCILHDTGNHSVIWTCCGSQCPMVLSRGHHRHPHHACTEQANKHC